MIVTPAAADAGLCRWSSIQARLVEYSREVPLGARAAAARIKVRQLDVGVPAPAVEDKTNLMTPTGEEAAAIRAGKERAAKWLCRDQAGDVELFDEPEPRRRFSCRQRLGRGIRQQKEGEAQGLRTTRLPERKNASTTSSFEAAAGGAAAFCGSGDEGENRPIAFRPCRVSASASCAGSPWW